MLKSKDINDYFEAKLAELKPGVALGFDLCLYFSQNRHVMLWRKAGEVLTDGFLDKYRERGVERVWIHTSDAEAYQRYLNGEAPIEAPDSEAVVEAAPADGAETASESGEPAAEAESADAENADGAEAAAETAPYEPQTEQGKKICDILNDTTLEERRKKAQAAKSARDLLKEIVRPETLDHQADANRGARAVVRDVVFNAIEEAGEQVAEIWRLSNIDPDLEHAVNVATYAVLFALAFGRIDSGLVGDIALAGLLHDIGLSQVPAGLSSKAWNSFSKTDIGEYSQHVQEGLALIESYGPEINQRVRLLILQHHEKFDGTGYPQRLQGFKVDDVAQLLSIADILDSLCTGKWDGRERTLRETLNTLETLEKARTFPEHFNPEVFAAVLRWTRSQEASGAAVSAAKTVEVQAEQIMHKVS